MERPITQAELERAFVRSCAPTLLGAKAANLFTFCGGFAADCPACGETACCERGASPEERYQVSTRRVALRRLVSALDSQLAAQGMRVRVLAWRPFGALVYGYRPELVARHLADGATRRDLAQLGYPAATPAQGGAVCHRPVPRHAPHGAAEDESFVEGCLEHLSERFGETPVPHEVGYFLGYPAADVRGFIEHGGREFLCCGCWKVYADVRGAQRRFSRYRRCTRRALRLYQEGASILDIARSPMPLAS